MACYLGEGPGYKDFVHEERIWKDYVARENYTARKGWPEEHGYLVDEYNKLTHELSNGRDVPLRRGERGPKETKVPKTTAGDIGWVSGDPERQLEIYGRYPHNSRGKRDITKTLGWPELSI